MVSTRISDAVYVDAEAIGTVSGAVRRFFHCFLHRHARLPAIIYLVVVNAYRITRIPVRPAIPGFITEEQQAKKDDCSIETLRRRRKKDYGPRPVRFGRVWLYPEDASERFLAEQLDTAEKARTLRGRGRPRADSAQSLERQRPPPAR